MSGYRTDCAEIEIGLGSLGIGSVRFSCSERIRAGFWMDALLNRVQCLLIGLPALLLGLNANGQVVQAALPFIAVKSDSLTAFRERETGKPFVSVGLNYFDPEVGWAPKLWQRFDEARVRRHLEMIHDAGFNTIRVFLTYQSFHRVPGQLFPEGEAKFRALLEICRPLGIYVIPSGPDHWEGRPAWLTADKFADEAMLKADEQWWAVFARRFRDEPAILAYDLYNEPSIGWDSASMKTRWNEWLRREYESIEQIAAAWSLPLEQVGRQGEIAVPPPTAVRGNQRLYDYQRFRESVADDWTRRMAAAIRSVDGNHMVTVGQIQWAVPVKMPEPRQYAAFNPATNARYVDFTTIHFYAIDVPRPCDGPEGTARNSAYLELLLRECSVGKPVMIGEFGWYGGGEEKNWNLPPRPPEHQVEWCSELLRVSRGRVCGWLNWAFADTPTSTDITRWSGCWTTDLKLKPWGRVFSEFARQGTQHPEPLRPFGEEMKSLPCDRRDLITDPKAGDECRRAWLQMSRPSTSPG